jgi:hypothetical protein
MDTNQQVLLRRLRRLSKAYDKLSRAVPNPEMAEKEVDKAFFDVLSALQDENLASLLNEMIPGAREEILSEPNKFDESLKEYREKLIIVETSITSEAGVRHKDITRMYMAYQKEKTKSGEFVTDAQELRDKLTLLHYSARQQIKEARKLSPKGKKKKRKRNVAQGIVSAIFGTGVITADIYLPALFVFSYGLGGSALHQALRDITGSKE